jgi:molybdopterin-guanine dinucleotide biosynthesis protein A
MRPMPLLPEYSPLVGGVPGSRRSTTPHPAGRQALDKLVAAYHASLAKLLDGWSPEQESELATLLRRVATQLLSADTYKELGSPDRSDESLAFQQSFGG